jgi:hypothetical protein
MTSDLDKYVAKATDPDDDDDGTDKVKRLLASITKALLKAKK